MTANPGRDWLDYLEDEDLAFIRRLVLVSGSLKELAAIYGISYPTVRLRLDRLIAKLQILDDRAVTSQFERVLRAAHAEGKVDLATMRGLLAAHQKDLATKKGVH
jgi:hypothetical protein